MAHPNPAPGHWHTPVKQPVTDGGPARALQPAAAGEPVAVSATVAGLDGAVIGSVTRHREADPTGPTHSHELVVVSVIGDLDADTGPLLHMALTEALDANFSVCCDLSRVAFFGAAGVNTVLTAHLRAIATGRQFTVRGVHGITARVLAITGLDQMLTSNDRTTPPDIRPAQPDEGKVS